MATRESGGSSTPAGPSQPRSRRTSTDHHGLDDLQERREQLDEDVDAILDEIDEVLETNAAEFVQAFVQKGGQ